MHVHIIPISTFLAYLNFKPTTFNMTKLIIPISVSYYSELRSALNYVMRMYYLPSKVIYVLIMSQQPTKHSLANNELLSKTLLHNSKR